MKNTKEMVLHTPLQDFKYNKSLIGKSTDTKIYMGATLLSPGEWTDSISNTKIEYSSKVLKKYATNWKEQYLNLDHNHNALSRVGKVVNQRFEDGVVKGDLHIYPITNNAKDIIKLIDNDMINWLSVEIMTEDIWNNSKDMWAVEEILYLGTAIVTLPASKNSLIKPDGIRPSDFYYE